MTERDWHKDMDTWQQIRGKYSAGQSLDLTEAGIHWLQQYAAEKERADKLEQTLIQTTASLANTEALTRVLEATALKSNDREKKLFDALKNIRTITRGSTAYMEAAYAHIEAHKTLSELYPLDKEEEAK
ncbi:hypothetical protein D3C74_332750 [compost metagenome]